MVADKCVLAAGVILWGVMQITNRNRNKKGIQDQCDLHGDVSVIPTSTRAAALEETSLPQLLSQHVNPLSNLDFNNNRDIQDENEQECTHSSNDACKSESLSTTDHDHEESNIEIEMPTTIELEKRSYMNEQEMYVDKVIETMSHCSAKANNELKLNEFTTTLLHMKDEFQMDINIRDFSNGYFKALKLQHFVNQFERKDMLAVKEFGNKYTTVECYGRDSHPKFEAACEEMMLKVQRHVKIARRTAHALFNPSNNFPGYRIEVLISRLLRLARIKRFLIGPVSNAFTEPNEYMFETYLDQKGETMLILMDGYRFLRERFSDKKIDAALRAALHGGVSHPIINLQSAAIPGDVLRGNNLDGIIHFLHLRLWEEKPYPFVHGMKNYFKNRDEDLVLRDFKRLGFSDSEAIKYNRLDFYHDFVYMLNTFGLEECQFYFSRLNVAEMKYAHDFHRYKLSKNPRNFFRDANLGTLLNYAFQFVPIIVGSSEYSIDRFSSDLTIVRGLLANEQVFLQYLSAASPKTTAVDAMSTKKFRTISSVKNQNLMRAMLQLPEEKVLLLKKMSGQILIEKFVVSTLFMCTGFWKRICLRFQKSFFRIKQALRRILNKQPQHDDAEVMVVQRLDAVDRLLIASFDNRWYHLWKKNEPYTNWESSVIMFDKGWKWVWSKRLTIDGFLVRQMVKMEIGGNFAFKYDFARARDKISVEEAELSELMRKVEKLILSEIKK